MSKRRRKDYNISTTVTKGKQNILFWKFTRECIYYILFKCLFITSLLYDLVFLQIIIILLNPQINPLR